jgi:hypothetical protein
MKMPAPGFPGPPNSARSWSLRESYMLYSSGFRDGASTKAMRSNCKGALPYDQGYADGQKAYQSAVGSYCKAIGHTPSILRTTE